MNFQHYQRSDLDLWGELGLSRGGPRTAEAYQPIQARVRPLRIAVFVNEFPALSETFVLNQITGLLDLGHDVTIFAAGRRNDPMVHPDVRRYGLDKRTRYCSMPKRRIARLARAPGIMLGERAGVRHLRSLDIASFGREALSLGLLYWTDTVGTEAPFDIIHCHFGTVGRLAARLRDIGAIRGKLVVTFHGVDMSACLDQDPDLYRDLFARIDLAMPISERWRNRLVELGCNPERIAVHRMGVDPDRFRFQPRRRSANRPYRILTVGRLVEKKGHAFGLRAVAALASAGIPVSYTIVGDGPETAALMTLSRELAIGDRVDFLGWQTSDEVAGFMAESDVLLAPSITDRRGDQEGIPVTLMEAMASGLPVVASRHSGIPEIIEHGSSGLLADEGDTEALAGCLEMLWRQPAVAQSVAQRARTRVLETYDIEKLNRDLERRFRRLLAS